MMKAWWDKCSARVDALTVRERLILFVSIMVCCIALADTFFLTPAQSEQQKVAQQFSAQMQELDRLRQELQTGAQPSEERLAMRSALEATQAQIEAVNREVQSSAPDTSGDPALERVLVEFLRREKGLTLLGTRTLKQDVPSSLGAGTAPPPANATDVLPEEIRRRGLELRVSGPYAELVRYVKTLEIALPKLRWGAMKLDATKSVPELTLQVYLVGIQP
jgi:MSHA biogenesis protein MshJ